MDSVLQQKRLFVNEKFKQRSADDFGSGVCTNLRDKNYDNDSLATINFRQECPANIL